jgi:hypothetical protein
MAKLVLEHIDYKYNDKSVISDFSYCFTSGNVYLLHGQNVTLMMDAEKSLINGLTVEQNIRFF